MSIFSRIFKRKSQNVDELNNITSEHTSKDYVDEETGEVTKSAIIYDRNNDRLLKLENDSCALVIHGGGKVEVVFTHLYDSEKQRVTAEEETLMSIAMLMRQPGFTELLRTTFHNVAMRHISKITETEEN
jgi:hypothetical protein